jgi:hypothetical protein
MLHFVQRLLLRGALGRLLPLPLTLLFLHPA